MPRTGIVVLNTYRHSKFTPRPSKYSHLMELVLPRSFYWKFYRSYSRILTSLTFFNTMEDSPAAARSALKFSSSKPSTSLQNRDGLNSSFSKPTFTLLILVFPFISYRYSTFQPQIRVYEEFC